MERAERNASPDAPGYKMINDFFIAKVNRLIDLCLPAFLFVQDELV